MEVPTPDSGEAAATGKRGAGVGRAPLSPGKVRARGRGTGGDAKPGCAPGGGRAGRPRWGRGAEGARRKGEGLPAVPVLLPWPPVPLQSTVSSFLPLACCPPPMKNKPKTYCRRVAFASEAAALWPKASALRRRSRGWGGSRGEGGVALASARLPPSAARDRLSPPGTPQSAPGALGVRGPGRSLCGQSQPLSAGSFQSSGET